MLMLLFLDVCLCNIYNIELICSVFTGMDPFRNIEIRSPAQLDCLRGSPQNKSSLGENGNKWSGLLCGGLDCTGKLITYRICSFLVIHM